jgi:hypothetical protein
MNCFHATASLTPLKTPVYCQFDNRCTTAQ